MRGPGCCDAGRRLNSQPDLQRAPLFRFETDELWLNLHHFLYVLGRAEAKTQDSSRDAVACASADVTRLFVSRLGTSSRGASGLETVFQEGMHQWDGEMQALLREKADAIGKRMAPTLSHGLIFFAAGEAVRSVFPNHVPVADAA